MNIAVKTLAVTLFTVLCIPCALANAQTGDEFVLAMPIITPSNPAWLLEQPYEEGSTLVARTMGNSAYGARQEKAALAISCYRQSPRARLTLEIRAESLGFDVRPFEGKDASANGPLRTNTGTRTAFNLPVNGVWTYGSAFQIGTIFALSTSLPQEELAYWLSDASRGQPLTLSLAPATQGGEPLIATFALPKNNSGLKAIFQSCSGTAAPR